MIGNLSPKQKQALFLIKETIKKTGKPPTLGELRELLRLKYINSVTHLINKLEEKGYIRRKRGEPRGIELASQEKKVVGIPLIGAVACGKPLLAQENIEGYISVDKNWLRGNPQDFFFLRAVGDSMNSAGIDDGDLTLIKIQSTANPNDQVVALIEDEATIKIYKP
ncbi:MAG: repressor LexA, partial [Candidatus Omnitrophica bacterium]|nr:repressor LexA [Candidatus Omnitrophota bacterium]